MSGAWRWSYHLLRMTQSLHRLGRRHNTFEEVVTKVGTVIYTLSKPSGLKSNLQTFVVHKPYYCESSSQVSLAFLFCCPADRLRSCCCGSLETFLWSGWLKLHLSCLQLVWSSLCALEMHSELESQSNQNLQQVAVDQNNSYHLLSKNNWSLKTVDLESIVSFQRSTF